MEKVVFNGIPIQISPPKRERKEIKIALKGPNKEWDFYITGITAYGYVKNIHRRGRKTPGETTALGILGMREFEKYAKSENIKFIYFFHTDDPNLSKWLEVKGKRALGLDEEGKRRFPRVN
ncbi:MAG TPA: hypothetical protein VF189_06010 [Patescibacteria group bacterium]